MNARSGAQATLSVSQIITTPISSTTAAAWPMSCGQRPGRGPDGEEHQQGRRVPARDGLALAAGSPRIAHGGRRSINVNAARAPAARVPKKTATSRNHGAESAPFHSSSTAAAAR